MEAPLYYRYGNPQLPQLAEEHGTRMDERLACRVLAAVCVWHVLIARLWIVQQRFRLVACPYARNPAFGHTAPAAHHMGTQDRAWDTHRALLRECRIHLL